MNDLPTDQKEKKAKHTLQNYINAFRNKDKNEEEPNKSGHRRIFE